jgi:hypothetical protein
MSEWPYDLARFFRPIVAPCFPSAVRTDLGKCEMVFFFFAAAAAFLMFFRAALLCLVLGMRIPSAQ